MTALRARTNFKLGDSVVVKPGIVDSDTGGLIGGWQGRITEIDEEAKLILIAWDSITLRDMSDDAIAECEEKGMDWRCYYLGFDDVEPGSPRDKQEDVEAMVELRGSEHEWTYLGEEGKRIQAVLDKAEDDSEWAAFEAWEEHLGDVLKFPFVAEVSESLGRGPMRVGERVRVLGIQGIDDPYGVLVIVNADRRKFVFPLCNLEAHNQSTSNYQHVHDYSVWFANR